MFTIFLKFCDSNSQGLSDQDFINICLKYKETKNPERFGMGLLTLSGKQYRTEITFEKIQGSGIGWDLILPCDDMVLLGKYLHGKHVMDLTISMWKEDMNRYIFRVELEKEYPKWFLNKVLGPENLNETLSIY